MINGEMSEAKSGYATLEDTDQRTFVRFLEWAYQGFYTPGDWVLRETSSLSDRSVIEEDKSDKRVETHLREPEIEDAQPAQPADEIEEPLALEELEEQLQLQGFEQAQPLAEIDHQDRLTEGRWGAVFAPPSISYSRKDKKRRPVQVRSIREDLKTLFIKRKPVVRQESIIIPPPRPNKEPDEDYSHVFLSHAQLYVFAEAYDIQPLRLLALDNLQNVLAIFTLYKNRTTDIIALLKYVYKNTNDPTDGIEDLRTLLTQYMGFEMGALMKDEEFRDVMIDDGGAMLGDFMKMVLKRID